MGKLGLGVVEGKELIEQDIENKWTEAGMKHVVETIQGASIEQKEKLNIQAAKLFDKPTEENFKKTVETYADYYEMLAKI